MFTVHIVNKTVNMFRSFEQNKNFIYIPFGKLWFKVFETVI